MADHALGPFELQCGVRLAGLRLRYELHGELNATRDNGVLFPTWFGGRHPANRWIIGPGRGLDTTRFCVIVVDALGNGVSSSPSNHDGLWNGGRPVAPSLWDNVRAQHELVRSLGIARLHAVVGRSMGAQQALQWGCLNPEMAGRVFAFCGVPRTTPFNRLLLEPIADVLEAACSRETGGPALRSAARMYAPWALSHAFFDTTGAMPSAWVAAHLEPAFQAFAPADLACLARTWQAADIAVNPIFKGDLRSALRAIAAPTFLMPISHDLLFPPADFALAAAQIPGVRCETLQSPWGHRAAAPGGDPADIAALEYALRGFLSPRP